MEGKYLHFKQKIMPRLESYILIKNKKIMILFEILVLKLIPPSVFSWKVTGKTFHWEEVF